MPRPAKSRTVRYTAGVTRFVPLGGSALPAETASLTLDQLEALRLADVSGLSHTAAARRMGVSRATFGRILASGRSVVADALLRGKAILIGGGTCTFTSRQLFYCPICRHEHSTARQTPQRCVCCDPLPVQER